MKETTIRERLALVEDNPNLTEMLIALLVKPNPNFAEIMLVFWGELEYNIDIMVAKTRQMDYAKARVTFLDRLPFDRKIKSLKEKGILTSEDHASIKRFQKRRNELFHTDRGNEHLYFTLTKKQKKERIEEARDVFLAVLFSAIRSDISSGAARAALGKALARANAEELSQASSQASKESNTLSC
jgi:hypothetical protein